MTDVRALVQEFVARLEAAIESEARTRVLGALGAARARGATAAKRAASAVTTPGRRLQGQYIGLLRSLTGRARQQVQSVARTKGVRAALKMARRLKRR